MRHPFIYFDVVFYLFPELVGGENLVNQAEIFSGCGIEIKNLRSQCKSAFFRYVSSSDCHHHRGNEADFYFRVAFSLADRYKGEV